MDEFHGIFCCPFLPSVLIIEDEMGGGGVALDREGWVKWEVTKPTPWDTP